MQVDGNTFSCANSDVNIWIKKYLKSKWNKKKNVCVYM